MAQVTKEYLAGFFDGEGCIHAHRNLKSISVYLTQANPFILQMVADIYGGKPKQNKTTKAYAWECPANSREKFLTDILPFVIVKRSQILLAIEWEIAKEKSMVRHPGTPVEYAPMLTTRKNRRIEKERIRMALINEKTKYYGHLRGNYNGAN